VGRFQCGPGAGCGSASCAPFLHLCHGANHFSSLLRMCLRGPSSVGLLFLGLCSTRLGHPLAYASSQWYPTGGAVHVARRGGTQWPPVQGFLEVSPPGPRALAHLQCQAVSLRVGYRLDLCLCSNMCDIQSVLSALPASCLVRWGWLCLSVVSGSLCEWGPCCACYVGPSPV
jgi:hypothetical protein